MQTLSGKTLDRLYNNRALVPEYETHFSQWRRDSVLARERLRGALDVAYGDGPLETLDVFPASTTNAPVLVFIHGGYWRSLDKSDHSFIAPLFTQTGTCVVIPNYALCPTVSIENIVMQMVKALAWTWRHVAQYGGDPNRITVIGHSAGGHLSAMMLACLWSKYADDLPAKLVKNAMSISGLYELDSIRRTPFLRDSLQLTPRQVLKLSPAWMPRPSVVNGRGVFYSVAGGAESAAFLAHQSMIQRAWGCRVVPVCETLPGLDHFSILGALAKPEHRLAQLAQKLLAS